MSVLAKYYASLQPEGSSQSAFAQSLAGGTLGGSMAQGATPQVEEAQDNLAAETGELVGRLLKRRSGYRGALKAAKKAGVDLTDDAKAAYKKGATAVAFEGYGE